MYPEAKGKGESQKPPGGGAKPEGLGESFRVQAPKPEAYRLQGWILEKAKEPGNRGRMRGFKRMEVRLNSDIWVLREP